MDFLETAVLHMGVDLRGGNTGMAQHGLDRPQVRPMIQEVGSERMAKHMGRDGLGNSGSNGTGL